MHPTSDFGSARQTVLSITGTVEFFARQKVSLQLELWDGRDQQAAAAANITPSHCASPPRIYRPRETEQLLAMASEYRIHKPYALATLPRPLTAPGQPGAGIVAREVYGQRDGVRKKRTELAVGIDGETASIYDVRSQTRHGFLRGGRR